MNNNDIFKKLRVALQLRDDQIVEILQLVDFRITKAELGAFFRNADHPNYMDCGDQVLRNFLNGLIIHLRGTKDNPRDPKVILDQNKQAVKTARPKQESTDNKPAAKAPAKKPFKKAAPPKAKKPIPVVEKVRFKNGKSKDK
ncbi:DUF1456 family protein [Flavobacterium sp. RHBU_3]|uniref:DUF1456 family protein n=1 Tax=Flavobacterium sp. RHBU_3 TaxID=3391184 RepID=UPI0039852E34